VHRLRIAEYQLSADQSWGIAGAANSTWAKNCAYRLCLQYFKYHLLSKKCKSLCWQHSSKSRNSIL